MACHFSPLKNISKNLRSMPHHLSPLENNSKNSIKSLMSHHLSPLKIILKIQVVCHITSCHTQSTHTTSVSNATSVPNQHNGEPIGKSTSKAYILIKFRIIPQFYILNPIHYPN
jgi:hypothetical protein